LVIIYYGQRPTKSISWVLVVIVLPFVGPLLYYLFGVNRRKFKFFNTRSFENKRCEFIAEDYLEHDHYFDAGLQPRKEKLRRLICSNSGTNACGGNNIKILEDGHETFGAIFSAMENAHEYIHLQYYILEKGELLEKMLALFERKINEGVKIKIIYDSFGSYHLRGRPKKKFEKIGVEIYSMLPIRIWSLLFSLNYRNHRKIVVVDGKIAFTGGVNVSDKYIKSTPLLGQWKDSHLQMEGPIVDQLHSVFLKDFYFASQQKELDIDQFITGQEKKGNAVAQVVAGGPDSNQPVILQQYMAMIGQAKHTVRIANPYFLPGEAFLESVKIAAQQGVDIILMVPSKSDSHAARYAMYFQFERLMEVGVRIFLRTDFSHSKTIIVDDDLVSIGSGNFDNRSFEHNYETNIMMYDEKLAKDSLTEFERVLETATQLDYETFKKRPSWHKFLEGLSRFFKPLL
jgi:cardiolipin synthase